MAITFGGVLNTDYVLVESASNAPDRDFTKPSGLSDGDVLVVEWNESAEGVTITPPSGWTERVNHDNTAGDAVVSTHMFTRVVATASGEPATYEFTSTASVPFAGGIYLYRGVDNTTPIDAGPQTRDKNNSNTLDFTGITTVTDGAWLLSTAGLQPAGAAQTATSPWSGPIRNSTVGQRGWFDHVEQATAGASGTVTWTFSVSNRDPVGYLIALRPATGGGGDTVNAAFISAGSQLFAATLTATATVAGAFIASGSQLFPASIAYDQTLSGAFLASASQTFAAGITSSTTVAGAFINSGSQTFTATLTSSATVDAAFIASGSQLFAATVTGDADTVSAAFISSGSQTFAATITSTVTLSGAFISSESELFPAIVTSGTVVQAAFISSGSQTFAATITPGTATVAGAFISSGSQTFAATLDATVTVAGAFIASGSETFVAGITSVYNLEAAFISSGAQLFGATITSGATTISAAFIASGSELFTATVSFPTVEIGSGVFTLSLAGRGAFSVREAGQGAFSVRARH